MKRINSNLIDFICRSHGKNEKGAVLSTNTTHEDSIKLVYVYRGTVDVDIDKKRYTVPEGCSFAVFPYTPFKIYNDDNMRYAWVEFSGFEAIAIVSRIAITKENPILPEIGVEHFEEMFDFAETGMELHDIYRRAARLLFLFSYYIEKFPKKEAETVSYVLKARRVIEEHYTDHEFGVKQVAEQLKIDRSYLYRRFKDELGISVIDYIARRRIAHAEIMLSNPHYSIKDVAYSSGFTDQLYFSRVFKKLNGRTPSQFREMIFQQGGVKWLITNDIQTGQ